MGSTSSPNWKTKAHVKEAVLKELHDYYATVEHKLVGNELWTLVGKEGSKRIVLFLLNKCGNEWGYKDIGEEQGPYYYNVPKSFLEKAPVLNTKWRQEVAKRN